MKKFFYLVPVFFAIFLQGCFAWRALKWRKPDLDDGKRMPHKHIAKSKTPNHVPISKNQTAYNLKHKLDSVLPGTKTAAFIVYHQGQIQYEYYGKYFDSAHLLNGFSLVKSFLGALTGIAIQEGFIQSSRQPITDFLPELLNYDSIYKKITLQHLLDMRSGLITEYNSVTIAGCRYYYGNHIRNKIKNVSTKWQPGSTFYYENANSQILSWVLEKATGKNIDQYLQEKIWQPAGMENAAIWNTDNQNTIKAFCCLSATARDFLKLGILYLDSGRIQGKQIIPESWVMATTRKDTLLAKGYKNYWWAVDHYQYCSDSAACVKNYKMESCTRYYHTLKDGNKSAYWQCMYYADDYVAQGLFNQFIFVNPVNRTIIVRLGNDQKNIAFYPFIRELLWTRK